MEIDLIDSVDEKVDKLAKKWNVDRDYLTEEFSRIYNSNSVQENEKIESEEQRQEFALERLFVEIGYDKENVKAKNRRNFSGMRNGKKMDLGLFRSDGTKLNPLSYSTGKNQVEVIEEILEAFESSDDVFLRGVVGSGKSVLGIRTAMEFGGGIVSVPTNVLSDQYQQDYEGSKYFLKDDGEKLDISVLKGRDNFLCPFLEDKYPNGDYNSCQNKSLPCSRPLSEDESRMEALEDCPYWGFIFPASRPLKRRSEHEGTYKSLIGRHSVLLKGGCPYWEQYKSYISSDVHVLNSAKWEIEAWIGRLPSTDITIIDEADAWLDSLCSQVSVTEKKIQYLLNNLSDEGLPTEAKKVRELWSDYRSGYMEPLPLAEELEDILEGLELGSNLFWNLKRVLEFKEEIVSETEDKKITYYIPDPKPVLSELQEKIGGKWLMMSATVQDPAVLEEIYGIDPIFVEGEGSFPGKLVRRKLGSEMKVNNRRWKIGRFRKKYGEIRDEIFKKAKKPGFVPVHATKYLPDSVRDLTSEDQKEVGGMMFSTKMDRGADLNEMESVVILKYPFPGLGDPLLRATKKKLGKSKFWMYYRDMSRREFIQQVGRTVRSPDEVVEFWSPDAKCHQKLKEDWEGEIVEGSIYDRITENSS